VIDIWPTPFALVDSLLLEDVRYVFEERVELTLVECVPLPELRDELAAAEPVPEVRLLKERATPSGVSDRSRRWIVEVGWQYVALQIIDESLYGLSERPTQQSKSLIWLDSPWLADFKKKHTMVPVLRPRTKHYIILTSFDVIDILNDVEPQVRSLDGE